MSDFRYNETAEAFEDKLEEVMDAHHEEVEKEASADAAETLLGQGELQMEPPALERIVGGHTAKDEIERTLAEAKTKEASVQEQIFEHRVAEQLRKIASNRQKNINEFLAMVRS